MQKSELDRQVEWVARNIHREPGAKGKLDWNDYKRSTRWIKHLSRNPEKNFEG